MRASTSEITIMPVIVYHIILQEVGYFENSITSSSLRRQDLYSFRYLYKFQDWKMKIVMTIHFVHKFALYIPTTAINRRPVM